MLNCSSFKYTPRISTFIRLLTSFLLFCHFVSSICLLPNNQMTSSAKLYFRHGAVSSAKTLNLLAVAHTYRIQGKNVLLLKPSIDTRFGHDEVRSRAGLTQKADYLITKDTNIMKIPGLSSSVHCVLVDEAQFLDEVQIDQLRLATLAFNVPVFCYGLRTDFRTNLFPGSRRLLEIADVIEELVTTCHFCANTAVLNLKHVNGVADITGPTVQLGAEEKYYPTCFSCYRESLVEARQPLPAGWEIPARQDDDDSLKK